MIFKPLVCYDSYTVYFVGSGCRSFIRVIDECRPGPGGGFVQGGRQTCLADCWPQMSVFWRAMSRVDSRVDSFDSLCRLCASYDAVKLEIFGEEGKEKSLVEKIQTCLPFQVRPADLAPVRRPGPSFGEPHHDVYLLDRPEYPPLAEYLDPRFNFIGPRFLDLMHVRVIKQFCLWTPKVRSPTVLSGTVHPHLLVGLAVVPVVITFRREGLSGRANFVRDHCMHFK